MMQIHSEHDMNLINIQNAYEYFFCPFKVNVWPLSIMKMPVYSKPLFASSLHKI